MSEINDNNNKTKNETERVEESKDSTETTAPTTSTSSTRFERIHTTVRLPWGATRERLNLFSNMALHSTVSLNINTTTNNPPLQQEAAITGDKKKPGEYVMHLLMLNFIQATAKKFEQITNEKRVRHWFFILKAIVILYIKEF